MKKVILLLVTMGFVLFCSFALAQGWNNTVTTSINEPNLDKMDLFTNKDGNHILIKRSDGTLIYYNINSSGTVDASKTETLESNSDFPNIVGSNEKIYAVYKSGDYIKGKYSTNGGTDWSSISNLSISSNTCNGVDAVYQDNYGVHVVWATKDSDPYYETYYYRLNTSDSWVDYKNVTDYGSEVGGFPTVTFSTDRVHVSYNTGTSTDPVYNQGEAKTRDKYDGTWQTPQMVFDDKNSGAERAFSDNTTLFDFYYKFIGDMSPIYNDLYVKTRAVGGTTWSSPTLIEYYAHPGKLVSTSKTNDGKTNIFYEAGYPATIYHKSYDGEDWSDGYSVATISSGYLKAHSSSSVANDLFVTLKESSSDYVKYRQYDALPLAPQNLSWSNTGSPYYHPIISWSAVNEPDVRSNSIGIRIERRLYNGETNNWGNWSEIASASGESTSYTDSEINNASGAGDGRVQYRIRSKDLGNHYSDYSNTIDFRFGISSEKISVINQPLSYSLAQNYPNPFNPTTLISYQTPTASFVSIKVFDVLGNEVAVLVNEVKPEGFYEVEFNADNLPSGIYIYKMQAGKFTAVNKMILMR